MLSCARSGQPFGPGQNTSPKQHQSHSETNDPTGSKSGQIRVISGPTGLSGSRYLTRAVVAIAIRCRSFSRIMATYGSRRSSSISADIPAPRSEGRRASGRFHKQRRAGETGLRGASRRSTMSPRMPLDDDWASPWRIRNCRLSSLALS